MKIGIEEVKQIPKEVDSKGFGVCVYGEPSPRIREWAEFHRMEMDKVGPYTNIMVAEPIVARVKNLADVFEDASVHFKYLDGFSPNLNKTLHVGHASNLVLAKAFQCMELADYTVSILGDTLAETTVTKAEAWDKFNETCLKYDYQVDITHLASNMKLKSTPENFVPGTGKNEGTMVFIIDGKEIVGIKSDGSTTYTYQDVAFAQQLDASTLYLTGNEQGPHFADLKKMFPNVNHIGLGLVKAGGSKMSSREGNVIMFSDVEEMFLEQFNGDEKLAYNVLAGFILKSVPRSDKNIDMDMLSNPLNSPGLYLSYTLAKLKSAGVEFPFDIEAPPRFLDPKLQFAELKAKKALQPNILFDALVEHAKYISTLYQSLRIKDNEANRTIFGFLMQDLRRGMERLGLYDIDKV